MDSGKIVRLNKLFVGGISIDVTEDEMRSHFANFGKIIDLVIIRDKETKQSRGFGFVTYELKSSMIVALNQQHYLAGKLLDLKEAKPKKTTRDDLLLQGVAIKKIFVGGIPKEVTKKMFREHFEKYGYITDIVLIDDRKTMEPRGFGFVCFEHTESVESVMFDYANHCLAGKWVEVKPALPRSASSGPTEFPEYESDEGFQAYLSQQGDLGNDYSSYYAQSSPSLASSHASYKNSGTVTTKQSSGYRGSEGTAREDDHFDRSYEMYGPRHRPKKPAIYSTFRNSAGKSQPSGSQFANDPGIQYANHPAAYVPQPDHQLHHQMSEQTDRHQEGPSDDQPSYEQQQIFRKLSKEQGRQYQTPSQPEYYELPQDQVDQRFFQVPALLHGPEGLAGENWVQESHESQDRRPYQHAKVFAETNPMPHYSGDLVCQSPLVGSPPQVMAFSRPGVNKKVTKSDVQWYSQSPFSVASPGIYGRHQPASYQNPGSQGVSPHQNKHSTGYNLTNLRGSGPDSRFGSPFLGFMSPAFPNDSSEANGTAKTSAWQPRRVLRTGVQPLSRYFDPEGSVAQPARIVQPEHQTYKAHQVQTQEGPLSHAVNKKSKFSLNPHHVADGIDPQVIQSERQADWEEQVPFEQPFQGYPAGNTPYNFPEGDIYTDANDRQHRPVIHHAVYPPEHVKRL